MRTPTRSPSVMASARSCVTSTVVVRSWRRIRAKSSRSASRVGWSSAENGSSSSSSSGSSTSARASAVRCASPPESVRAWRAARCPMPSRVEPRVHPRRGAVRAPTPRKRRPRRHVVPDGGVGEERLLEDAGHAPPHREALGRAHGLALEADAARGGRLEEAHHPEQGGLAGAVGPDDREGLARGHRQLGNLEERSPGAVDPDSRQLEDPRHAAGRTWIEPRCIETAQRRSRAISSIS